MVTKKYTPGPWGYYPTQNWCVKAACSDDICSVSHNDVGVEEMHANAHLIAAAPDMLGALEAAEESIVTFIGMHGYPLESGAGLVLDEIRAATAKAKGEAQ